MLGLVLGDPNPKILADVLNDFIGTCDLAILYIGSGIRSSFRVRIT